MLMHVPAILAALGAVNALATISPKPVDQHALAASLSADSSPVMTDGSTFFEDAARIQNETLSLSSDDPAAIVSNPTGNLPHTFYIYGQSIVTKWPGHVRTGFLFQESRPRHFYSLDCDREPVGVVSREDVSGTKFGARCSNCNDPTLRWGSDIGSLEIHDPDYGHWTIYKNRGYGMFDTHDNHVGSCKPEGENHHLYYCGHPFRSFVIGYSWFHCILDN